MRSNLAIVRIRQARGKRLRAPVTIDLRQADMHYTMYVAISKAEAIRLLHQCDGADIKLFPDDFDGIDLVIDDPQYDTYGNPVYTTEP